MHASADKGRVNRSKTLAHQPPRRASGSRATIQLVDNRPETVRLTKLQEAADNRARPAASWHIPKNNSMRLLAQRQRPRHAAAGIAQQVRSAGASVNRQNLSDVEALQGRLNSADGVIQRRLLSVTTFRERVSLPPGFHELPEEQLTIRRIEISKIEDKLNEYAELDTFENPQKALNIVNTIDSLIYGWILETYTKRKKKGLPDDAQFIKQLEAMQDLRILDINFEKQLLLPRINAESPAEQVKRNLEVITREGRGEIVSTGKRATRPKAPATPETSTTDAATAVASPIATLGSTGTSLASVFSTLADKAETARDISNLGGGINSTAAGVLSSVKGVSDIAKGFKAQSGNPAQVALGSEQIFSGTLETSTSIGSLADAAVGMADYIGGFTAVPLGGLINGPIKLTKGIAAFAKHSGLASAAKESLGALTAQSKEKEALALSFEHVRTRTIQLATHDAINVFTDGFGMVGSALALMGGPVAPAGGAIKTATSLLSGVNSVTKLLIDSYKAGKAQEAEKSYGKNELGAAAKLIKLHPLHAAQTIVEKAKRSDPIAVGFMSAVGLNEKQMEESSDKDLRALVLSQLDEEENPITLLQKIKAAPSKLASFFA